MLPIVFPSLLTDYPIEAVFVFTFPVYSAAITLQSHRCTEFALTNTITKDLLAAKSNKHSLQCVVVDRFGRFDTSDLKIPSFLGSWDSHVFTDLIRATMCNYRASCCPHPCLRVKSNEEYKEAAGPS